MDGTRIALAAVALALAWPAAAQESWDLWSITGSNTLRVEHYDIDGNRRAGPYLFDGPQAYDEFGLTATRAFSPWDRLRIQLYGVLNDSDYRALDTGFVPERFSITRENGEGALPYRFELGDTFGYFSYRTLQRSLKGLQVELQPGAGQSLVFLAGANQPSWRHLQARDDLTTGASWLMAAGPGTQLGANWAHNFRQADDVTGAPERRQDVYSLTGEHAWEAGTHRLRIEGEAAGFRGDHDGATDATGARVDGRDRQGQGLFAQLSGRDTATPLDYRLRFEQYDRDFRPNGAVILPDRRAIEAFAGWRLEGGLALRGRAQEFVDARDSGNAQTTRTLGANLSGPFGAQSGIVGQVDLFVQDADNELATIDRRSWVASANLGRTLGAGWYGQLGLYHQSIDDRIEGAPDSSTSQVTVYATRPWNHGDYSGSVSPGLSWRRVSDGPGALTDVTPVLKLQRRAGKPQRQRKPGPAAARSGSRRGLRRAHDEPAPGLSLRRRAKHLRPGGAALRQVHGPARRHDGHLARGPLLDDELRQAGARRGGERLSGRGGLCRPRGPGHHRAPRARPGDGSGDGRGGACATAGSRRSRGSRASWWSRRGCSARSRSGSASPSSRKPGASPAARSWCPSTAPRVPRRSRAPSNACARRCSIDSARRRRTSRKAPSTRDSRTR